MNFLFYPETSQTPSFFKFSNKGRVSSTKGCLLTPPRSLPPQENLVRRPTESKFELENINTTVCSPKRKKWSIFNPVFQNTQLCDFLIYCIPNCLQTALSCCFFPTHPLDVGNGAGSHQSRMKMQSSQQTVSPKMPVAQAGAPGSWNPKGARLPGMATMG